MALFFFILRKLFIVLNFYSKTALKLNSKGYDYFTQTLNQYNFEYILQ